MHHLPREYLVFTTRPSADKVLVAKDLLGKLNDSFEKPRVEDGDDVDKALAAVLGRSCITECGAGHAAVWCFLWLLQVENRYLTQKMNGKLINQMAMIRLVAEKSSIIANHLEVVPRRW
jgi:hypothetical protein